MNFFLLYTSVITFVLGVKKNHLIEMVLLSTHNICFGNFHNTLLSRGMSCIIIEPVH